MERRRQSISEKVPTKIKFAKAMVNVGEVTIYIGGVTGFAMLFGAILSDSERIPDVVKEAYMIAGGGLVAAALGIVLNRAGNVMESRQFTVDPH